MTDRMLCRIGDGTDQSQPSTVQSCFDHGYVVGKAFLDCEHLLYGVLHAGSWPGMQLTHCRLYIYIHVLRSICLCISFSEKEDNMLEYMFFGFNRPHQQDSLPHLSGCIVTFHVSSFEALMPAIEPSPLIATFMIGRTVTPEFYQPTEKECVPAISQSCVCDVSK